MSVYDQWHKSRPKPGESRCSCRPAKVPTKAHGAGKRWQVRWRDDAGKPQKLNFDKLPDAQRKDAQIRASIDRGDYIDPNAGRITLTTYTRQWRAGQTVDPSTLERTDSILANWVYRRPIGDQAMGVLAKRPSLVQAWVKDMQTSGLEASTIGGIVGLVSTVFDAAVDDQVVGRNPCQSRTVKPPRAVKRKVVPWTLDQVDAMSAELPDRYAAMAYLGAGCAHRQGELFGVAVEDIDFLGRVVHVVRQVRIIGRQLVFSPPKRGKVRDVPLPESVGLTLSAHIAAHPPVKVTLPWKVPDGELVTVALLFTTSAGQALNRPTFNDAWRASLAGAGIAAGRANGMHVLRHTAASAWLAAGVDIRTVADYLGHSDPGFTLRTYTHLMPDAADRARKAMDMFFASSSAGGSSALIVPGNGAS
ncbi:tyrosine-type recombinase/integrase [Nonomuraea angiospora]|uniref:tyrosine-type recombinase/integrase n=1 Tax=Nonomuraea angiospora TaxID=46172 RepID=UPI00340158BC